MATTESPAVVRQIDISEMVTLNRSFEVEIYSTTFFFFVYFLTRFLYSRLSKEYIKLAKNDKIEYNSRVVSNVNAIISTLGSSYVLFVEAHSWYQNPFQGNSFASYFFLKFIWGYFLYDTLLVCYYRNLFDYGTLFHHVLGLYLYNIGIVCGNCHFVLISYIFTEITTPFVNFRWILYQTNRKDGLLYMINGLCLALGFLIVRVIYIPLSIGYQLYDKYPLSFALPEFVWYGTYFGFVLINLLNMFWAFLIWRGLIRLAFSSNKQKSK
ncbi:hypothetical protein DLAC_01797 [Tieghemostelium lacteum]|uniref:TLC domain-containing protein n=1 Tax=Tieghemostelium lacteum TaxID=361077 RepID=A0A152A6P3_TIELA|nr:hypothetical protein DLAC_01797 [Tieghemostelium lacteum]|eukprot:KYR01785.1 hypothetical protein DLAC_01797 [Tieghemostelium lacteum]